MTDLTPPDYSSSYERYAFPDPILTETSYDSIKDLKQRITSEAIDLRIDSHKGFLRCEEPDCKFALKIRYGSAKGSVILGKSRYGHNHDPHKPKSFKKRKSEVLERYYDLEVARDIKLKKLIEAIEKELGESLVGEDLKKFKNKIYNIRQKIRREEEKKASTSQDSPPPLNPIPLPMPKEPLPPLKKSKKNPKSSDEIKKIINETKRNNTYDPTLVSVLLLLLPSLQKPSPQLQAASESNGSAKNDSIQVVSHTVAQEAEYEENNLFVAEEKKKTTANGLESNGKTENAEDRETVSEDKDKKSNQSSPSRISQLIKRIF